LHFIYIATSYELDSPGIDFPHLFIPALGPPSLLYNGYWVFPGGKVTGAWHWPANPI